MKIVLALEYDGRGYCGWQKQPGCLSVQSRLESALSGIAGRQIQVVAAGRTDAGVHALCQVVHFETCVRRPLNAWIRGTNALLPGDISILEASEVSDDFHARFSATERTYLYYLLSRPARPGIHYGKIGWVHYPLDLEKMQMAAKLLIGKHDFSAFRSSECQSRTAIRQLTRLNISQPGGSTAVPVPDISAPCALKHRAWQQWPAGFHRGDNVAEKLHWHLPASFAEHH